MGVRGSRSAARRGRGRRPAARATTFLKLTGSGNDFVFLDGRAGATDLPPERIRALCARGTGIGADGVVLLEEDRAADVRIRYFNSDGSPAALCGNATLCTVRAMQALGIAAKRRTLRIATDAGTLSARLASGTPEFDVGGIARVTTAAPLPRVAGERRVGYAVVGVPHLVVAVDDIERIDLEARGRALRQAAWTGTPGANANFVAPDVRGGWAMRTYERGVEGETLACGTGAVATAILLVAWREASEPTVRIWTRSGKPLDVSVSREGAEWQASLRGEGRLVFVGQLVQA